MPADKGRTPMNVQPTTRIARLTVMALLLCATAAQATILHEFAGGASDGNWPNFTTPTVSGTTLYGLTAYGGAVNCGALFKMNTDGSGYSILRLFAGGASDGSRPQGSLTLDGSTLYGMTAEGGTANYGAVFKVNTDGSGYSILRLFAGGVSDGRYPRGSLTLSGSTLYGTTQAGGDANRGTVFKMNTDGSGFSLLREFVGGADDGRSPRCDLTLSGSTLYGTTYYGGDDNLGTVFKMNTDGSGFSLLYEFAGGVSDGSSPFSSLTLSGTTLYGMTEYGGDVNLGTIFQINTDGSGFSLLHEFAGGASDGRSPQGSLTLSGTTLYGMTEYGGDANLGTMFQINTDGSGYSLLREFAGGASDGSSPLGTLTLDGTTLYGMTLNGGDLNRGTVFSHVIPEPSTFALTAISVLFLLARRRNT
jgi:uncharacterized repeat protein (TIGR03803 family)